MDIPKGTPTGLHDSKGKPIKIGDLIKRTVTCNTDLHGKWCIYEVKLQGIVPILSYVRSEKGEVLPKGYLAVALSDEYDQKLFVFTTRLSLLKPIDDLHVVKEHSPQPSPQDRTQTGPTKKDCSEND